MEEPGANCWALVEQKLDFFSVREICQGTEQRFLLLLSELSWKWWLNMIGAESRVVWAATENFAQFFPCWIETDGLKSNSSNNSGRSNLNFIEKNGQKTGLKVNLFKNFIKKSDCRWHQMKI